MQIYVESKGELNVLYYKVSRRIKRFILTLL
nr:MAG TPA: hypothetical protein [Caudoviricetes sp.]